MCLCFFFCKWRIAMAATPNFLFVFSIANPFSPPYCHIHHHHPHHQQQQQSVLSPFLLFFFTFSFCSLTILIFSLYSKLTKKKINDTHQHLIKVREGLSIHESAIDNKNEQEREITHQSDPTHLTRSILLEILPSNSSKWAKLFANELGDAPNKVESGFDAERVEEGKDRERTKKKKRAKKKRPDSNSEEEGKKDSGVVKEKQELVCLYPFTKSSSATQRKIKQHYDELVRSHESNGLTLAQVLFLFSVWLLIVYSIYPIFEFSKGCILMWSLLNSMAFLCRTKLRYIQIQHCITYLPVIFILRFWVEGLVLDLQEVGGKVRVHSTLPRTPPCGISLGISLLLLLLFVLYSTSMMKDFWISNLNLNSLFFKVSWAWPPSVPLILTLRKAKSLHTLGIK